MAVDRMIPGREMLLDIGDEKKLVSPKKLGAHPKKKKARSLATWPLR